MKVQTKAMSIKWKQTVDVLILYFLAESIKERGGERIVLTFEFNKKFGNFKGKPFLHVCEVSLKLRKLSPT